MQLFIFTYSDIFALAVSDAPNTAPVVSNAIADVTANVASPFNFVIPKNTFSDAEGNPLTDSATLEDGSPLPSWLSFDTTTGSFIGTPTLNNLGSFNVKITASDGSLSVSDIFALAVSDLPNTARVVSQAISDASATATESFNLTIPSSTFSDANGNPLTYSATLEDGSPLPSWLSFDAPTNTFSGTPTANNLSNITLKITASDGSLSVSDTFTLTVSETSTPPEEEPPAETPNAAPLVENAISSFNVIAFQPFNFTLPDDAFIDPDGDSLTYSAILANGEPLPDWLQFEPITGTFSGLPTEDAIRNLTIKLVASDGTASVETGLSINDFIYGNQGDDTLDGGDGDDVIYGGKDNDILTGGNGDDWLFGDLGDDTLVGGVGQDRFVIRKDAGVDLIVDFTATEDLIGLAPGLTVDNLTLTQGNSGTLIYAGNDLLAILNGVEVSAINQQDFFTVG